MDFADPRTKLTLRNLQSKGDRAQSCIVLFRVYAGPLRVTAKGCGHEAGGTPYVSVRRKPFGSVDLLWRVVCQSSEETHKKKMLVLYLGLF